MDFVIITGMSGAGKTSALHVLEDIGYYSVDNIPASLLPMLYTLCSKSDDSQMHRVAVVVDVRGTEIVKNKECRYKNLFNHNPGLTVRIFYFLLYNIWNFKPLIWYNIMNNYNYMRIIRICFCVTLYWRFKQGRGFAETACPVQGGNLWECSGNASS